MAQEIVWHSQYSTDLLNVCEVTIPSAFDKNVTLVEPPLEMFPNIPLAEVYQKVRGGGGAQQ